MLIALAPALVARSAPADKNLANYTVSSWTAKDGIPSNVIWSLAQDGQGYLWLGTNAGLVRFDGEQFLNVQALNGVSLPTGVAGSVFKARDKSLWVGFSTGDVIRIHEGRVQAYDTRRTFTPGLITTFAEDRQGTIWVGSSTGLFAFDGKTWSRADGNQEIGHARIISAYVTRSGDLYVGSERGIFLRKNGQPFKFVEAWEGGSRFQSFAEDAAGQLWMSDSVVGYRRVGVARSREAQSEQIGGNEILFDRSGYLWIATVDQGIWRMSPARGGEIERTRMPGARSLLEDSEGNIWAATGSGLFRFSRSEVIPLRAPRLATAVESTSDGSVWVSTIDTVTRFAAGDPTREKLMFRGERLTSVRADSREGIWIATRSQVIWLGNAPKNRRIWQISDLGLTYITAMVSDREGTLWLTDRDHGIFRWNPNCRSCRPTAVMAAQGLLSAYADTNGQVWFAGTEVHPFVVDPGGGVKQLPGSDLLNGNEYSAIFEDHNGDIWFGEFGSPFLLHHGRFLTMNESRPSRQAITAISEDAFGNIWLATTSGIECLRREEVDAQIAGGKDPIWPIALDTSDGLPGMPFSPLRRNLARAADGRFWVVTGDGVSIVNPSVEEGERPPSNVEIDDILVNDHALTNPGGARLPASTNRIQVNYSALDLTSPHPIQFRYQLVGFDKSWIDSGTSRQAVYTHLWPRAYRFLVEARAPNGPWSAAQSSWDFSIRPAFYQTVWFVIVCILALAAFVLAGFRLHENRLRLQFAAVLSERFRLSRELHDTLLQTLVAAALHFHAASEDLEPSSPAHRQIVLIRKELEHIIREARRSIRNLRATGAANQDLVSTLREMTDHLTREQPVQAQFAVHGKPFQASVDVEQQLARIAQEAALNAVRHSGASTLKLDLLFEEDAITLRVADDGTGLDLSAASDGQSGHYGLITMKERAEQLHGRLKLTSEPGSGTVVEASVPAGLRD